MAWMLGSTVEKNCSKRIILISLSIITCILTYIFMDLDLTSMTISKGQYGYKILTNTNDVTIGLNVSVNLRLLSEAVLRNVTRETNSSKLQKDMTSKSKDIQHDTAQNGRVHYFRCANPIGRLGNLP